MRKLFIVLGLLLSACSGSNLNANLEPPRATNIVCHAAYRSGVDQPIEREEALTFEDSDLSQSIEFPEMVFHAEYNTGEFDNERTLRVWVTDIAGTKVYQSHLYQLDPNSGPVNQFRGGHGFTGLNYGYHAESPAEIQFWCETTN